ncbi:hypothetical protein J6590_019006 [Homalodisca vitripennis]|nr:hypothetical protein J6590_019006 [Homalodisca vitripennis]
MMVGLLHTRCDVVGTATVFSSISMCHIFIAIWQELYTVRQGLCLRVIRQEVCTTRQAHDDKKCARHGKHMMVGLLHTRCDVVGTATVFSTRWQKLYTLRQGLCLRIIKQEVRSTRQAHDGKKCARHGKHMMVGLLHTRCDVVGTATVFSSISMCHIFIAIWQELYTVRQGLCLRVIRQEVCTTRQAHDGKKCARHGKHMMVVYYTRDATLLAPPLSSLVYQRVIFIAKFESARYIYEYPRVHAHFLYKKQNCDRPIGITRVAAIPVNSPMGRFPCDLIYKSDIFTATYCSAAA